MDTLNARVTMPPDCSKAVVYRDALYQPEIPICLPLPVVRTTLRDDIEPPVISLRQILPISIEETHPAKALSGHAAPPKLHLRSTASCIGSSPPSPSELSPLSVLTSSEPEDHAPQDHPTIDFIEKPPGEPHLPESGSSQS